VAPGAVAPVALLVTPLLRHKKAGIINWGISRGGGVKSPQFFQFARIFLGKNSNPPPNFPVLTKKFQNPPRKISGYALVYHYFSSTLGRK